MVVIPAQRLRRGRWRWGPTSASLEGWQPVAAHPSRLATLAPQDDRCEIGVPTSACGMATSAAILTSLPPRAFPRASDIRPQRQQLLAHRARSVPFDLAVARDQRDAERRQHRAAAILAAGL